MIKKIIITMMILLLVSPMYAHVPVNGFTDNGDNTISFCVTKSSNLMIELIQSTSNQYKYQSTIPQYDIFGEPLPSISNPQNKQTFTYMKFTSIFAKIIKKERHDVKVNAAIEEANAEPPAEMS